MTEEIVKSKKLKFNKKFLFLGLFVALTLIAASAPSIYFYNELKSARELLNNPSNARKVESEKLLKEIGNLLVLPEDEEPTIATVNNKDQLTSVPFFAAAQNGDKILIYQKAKKAIIFRPETGKIIEVAPINVSTPSSQIASVSATPTFAKKPTPLD